MPNDLALVDVSALTGTDSAARLDVARQIDRACRAHGFFRIVGHGAPAAVLASLDVAAREFFALPDAEKAAIGMANGGPAWRGWFEVGGELTSGRPDVKEGIYFGAELPTDHPAVRARRPLHGPNLFPARPRTLRSAVLGWMATMTELGHRLLGAVALGLGLDESWFARHVTADPTVLFRIFHYPPASDSHGVQEHTDYGLLTILAQDGTPGLEVRTQTGWIEVPPDPDVLVVNIGDMLDRMTAGRYRSTPHRVRNRSETGRLSFPFFFDPSWDAACPVLPLDGSAPADDAARRWDRASVHAWDGTYGEYLSTKVANVFPALFTSVTDPNTRAGKP
jgi:isopenicillin N synthase-like dioxygenase